VTNISIGTLVIVGLHIVAVTIANYALLHFSLFTSHFSLQYGYHWYEALPVALIIICVLYPIIIYAQRRYPIFLGRKGS
jgi:hypothetical protein